MIILVAMEVYLILILSLLDPCKMESINVAGLANGGKCIDQTSEYDERYNCNRALDGNTLENDNVGQNSGTWALRYGNPLKRPFMTIAFARRYTIDRLRLMQRWYQHILVRYIELDFMNGQRKKVRTHF